MINLRLSGIAKNTDYKLELGTDSDFDLFRCTPSAGYTSFLTHTFSGVAKTKMQAFTTSSLVNLIRPTDPGYIGENGIVLLKSAADEIIACSQIFLKD